MRMRDFIRDNRAVIDATIRASGGRGKIDDDEREMWILNDEGLYRWAKSAGVKI